jgi:hypothetical protein
MAIKNLSKFPTRKKRENLQTPNINIEKANNKKKLSIFD